MATEIREILDGEDTEFIRQLIVKLAVAQGFWSVWMTVFTDDQDMLQRLVDADAFPGTSKNCFDDQCHPVLRPGGAL